MPKYTFTFNADEERKFSQILSRLEPEEYTVIESIAPVDKENPKHCKRQTIMEMDSECALTFRMGMSELKIRRERTEEELAEEKEINDRHTVKVVVKIPSAEKDTNE